MDSTVHYQQHAQKFFDRSVGISMERHYKLFLKHLPVGAHILDAGCGSGRDSKVFRERGYRVTGFDATPKMAELARLHTGYPVRVLRFEEMDYEQAFDGLWASASLLHVALADLPRVLILCARALKPGGLFLASFKKGEGERVQGLRRFTDMTLTDLETLIQESGVFEILELLESESVIQGPEQIWVNALARVV